MRDSSAPNPAAAKMVLGVFLVGIGLSALIAVVGAKVSRRDADSFLTASPSPASAAPRSFVNLQRDLPVRQWRSVYGEAELARQQGIQAACKAYPAPPVGTPLSADAGEAITEKRAAVVWKNVDMVRAKHHLTETDITALILWGKSDRPSPAEEKNRNEGRQVGHLS